MVGSKVPSSHLLADSATIVQIRELLRSHSTPPDYILPLISELSQELVRYDDEISRWEDEISRIRPRLRQVESERTALNDYLVDCRSLLAPIRRMPTEVLVAIFALCADHPRDANDRRWKVVQRVAKQPLLILSQVCKRWHDVALKTPALWNTIVLGEFFYKHEIRTPEVIEKVLRQLKIVLDRGQNVPLHLVIEVDHPQLLELLARYSERWKTAEFIFSSSPIVRHLAGAKGRLPALETLTLHSLDSSREKRDHPFEAAPRLRSLRFSGTFLPSFEKPPLPQLDSVRCVDLDERDIAEVLVTMSRMAHGAAFRFAFYGTDRISLLDLPPISSHIIHLSVEIMETIEERDVIRILGHILASLTLPHLRDLSFRSEYFPSNLMNWPQTAFLDLARRSSFNNHLHSLHLWQIVIADTELITCLLALPVLESLAISDQRTTSYYAGVNHHLITDTLLSRLTLQPVSPPIIPRLRSLLCRTRLQFNDTVFLEFLLSRRVEQPSDVPPLICEMRSLPGRHRELDQAVAERVRELRVRQEVIVLFEVEVDKEF
ncbi:F-box domain-containing protein [Mycena sanguinolenta]|uniref:F-box domain-containing protein n=1 Tax=Mycena sanguinolenta TaxID=230812 RepID=A0A8H6X683_9AGAR|nr:F-box domain-containing protein [Mycena sanguinolenta]